jgi:putative transposase
VPLSKDLRPVYTAADEAAAAAALEDFAAAWGERYPAIVKVWRAHWAAFTPFLAFPPEVRRVIDTTNLIVIWSPRGGVLHVDHERLRGRDPRCGRGYLPLSITRISGGNHACSAGAVARLVA